MHTSNSAAAEWRGYWFLPMVAALGYATSTLHVYSMGPFVAPLQAEFGWSRAQISGGLTVAALISTSFSIPIGLLVDRVGPRALALIGVLLMSGSFALLGSATGSPTNWSVLWGVIAIGAIGIQPTVWTSAVASRFEASRGLAFAITLSGASFATAIYPFCAAWLIDRYDWRVAFFAMGGIWAACVFPLLLWLFRGAPKAPPSSRSTIAAPVQPGLTLAEGLRSPTFYKLLLAGGMFAFTIIASVVHFVPILVDSGTKSIEAAGIAALVGVFSVVGRLGTGVLLDKFPGHRVGAAAFLLPVFACLLLLFKADYSFSQMVAAAILGLSVGSEVDVIAFLAAKHFGLRSFGALYGALGMALGIGMAFGPLAAGAVFDRYQSYEPFLTLTVVLMTTSAIALFTLGSPPNLTTSHARAMSAEVA